MEEHGQAPPPPTHTHNAVSSVPVGGGASGLPRWLCWCPSQSGHGSIQHSVTWEVALTKHPCRSFAVGLQQMSMFGCTVPMLQARILRFELALNSQQEGASSTELVSLSGFLSERLQAASALLSPCTACIWGPFLHHRRLFKGIEGLHMCLTLTPSWGCLFLPSRHSPAEKQIITRCVPFLPWA